MDPKKIFVWNVGGLNSASRQSSVRSFVEACGADIVCLQETKMQNLSRGNVMFILGADFEQFLSLLLGAPVVEFSLPGNNIFK
jgi:exonuclease III